MLGGRAQQQRTGPSIRVLYRVFGLQTLVWRKLLVLNGKKLAFKFSMYIFEYRSLPLPPYVHLASTHVMNAPRPSLFFAGLPLPYNIFCERKQKVKTGEAWEQRLALVPGLLRFDLPFEARGGLVHLHVPTDCSEWIENAYIENGLMGRSGIWGYSERTCTNVAVYGLLLELHALTHVAVLMSSWSETNIISSLSFDYH